MNIIARDHPVIVGLACSTTGLSLTHHHPIGVALKVIEAMTGDIIGSYDTLIRVLPEVWEGRDIRAEFKNGITWEKLQTEGRSLEQVQKEIGIFLSVHRLTKNPFFVTFDTDFHAPFFKKILGGDKLIVPRESLFHFLFKRSIGGNIHAETLPVDFKIEWEDLGWLNYPRANISRYVGFPYKRMTCLGLLRLNETPGKIDHHLVANDICRVVKNLIIQERS